MVSEISVKNYLLDGYTNKRARVKVGDHGSNTGQENRTKPAQRREREGLSTMICDV